MMERASLAFNRAEIYAALALLFHTPEGKIGYASLAELLENALDHLPTERSVSESLDALKRWRRHPEPQDRLEEEALSLFYGPGKVLAPPYESVYTSPVRQVMGQAAFEVMDAYREAGFCLRAAYHDCPDHLAAELEFMAHLCAQEGEAVRHGKAAEGEQHRRQQREFVQRHLARWVPLFASDVRRLAATAFWRLAATVLERYLLQEAGEAGEGVGKLQNSEA